MAKHLFTFMGTGAGCGVPAFFCSCPACEEARKDPSVARGDCGILIRGIDDTGAVRPHSTLLIDTPPDTRHQMNREGVKTVDELLYTHWHSDHIGGLLEFEYMVQLVTRKPLPTYGSDYTLAQIQSEFKWMNYALDKHLVEPFSTHVFDDVSYTALPVHHAPGTFGWLIETDSTRIFYASDSGFLPAETKERIQNVDVIALDATYWGRNEDVTVHLDVRETIEEGLSINAKKIYLTHLCMHYNTPITFKELNEFLKQYDGRVEAAMDGLSFEI